MHSDRLGYLTTDPKNLGTALKLTVRIRLPKLTNDPRLSALLKSLNLNPKYNSIRDETEKSSDEKTQNKKSSIVEISSFQTLGKSEV
jgi:protein-arginine kinase